jgi:anti-sigma regulatory factor (Ser/Thr protein kinase)
MVIGDESPLGLGRPMRTDLDEIFPATTEGLNTALRAIEQFCTERNLDANLVSRARIIVEELFSNTIKYGYGGECDRPVRLRLTKENVLKLTLEDEAAKFDPLTWLADHPADLPADRRPEGKTGIALVRGLAAQLRYTAHEKGNRIEITIAE